MSLGTLWKISYAKWSSLSAKWVFCPATRFYVLFKDGSLNRIKNCHYKRKVLSIAGNGMQLKEVRDLKPFLPNS